MASFLEKTILLNNLEDCTLVEIYAGGAGASLKLLLEGICKKLILKMHYWLNYPGATLHLQLYATLCLVFLRTSSL